MIPLFPLIDDRPAPLITAAYGIALIGCGGIVNYAHLPAYHRHNLSIIGCFDQDRDAAFSSATAHNIPRIYDSVDEILADSSVSIVDIAIHP